MDLNQFLVPVEDNSGVSDGAEGLFEVLDFSLEDSFLDDTVLYNLMLNMSDDDFD